MELKSEKAFRIADLILRYQEETISEEEMEELRLLAEEINGTSATI